MGKVTVKELLSNPNPELTSIETGDLRGATTNINWPEVTLADIEPWKEFTVPIINAAWGDLYDSVVPEETVIPERMIDKWIKHYRVIEKEKDLDKIGRYSHAMILQTALDVTAPEIKKRFGTSFPGEVFIDWDQHDVEWEFEDDPLRMDWAVRFAEDKTKILVVGETKKRTVLTSDALENIHFINGKCKKGGSWPFRQGAAYAYYTGTRYVAFITSKEMFATEYFLITDSTYKKLGCRCAVIPRHGGDPELTVNFVLWVLAMYSLNDRHRHLDYRSNMTGLNVWYHKQDGKVSTYTNVRSGRMLTEREQIPEGAIFIPEENSPSKAHRPRDLESEQPDFKRRSKKIEPVETAKSGASSSKDRR